MDSSRCWFTKFMKKKEEKKQMDGSGIDVCRPALDDMQPSNVTKQKVAAAKQYIENHYRTQMKCLQERKERY